MSKADELVRIRLLRLDAEFERRRQERIDQVIYMLAAIVILPVLMLSRSVVSSSPRSPCQIRALPRFCVGSAGCSHLPMVTGSGAKAAKWVPFTPAPSLTALASRSEPPSAAG